MPNIGPLEIVIVLIIALVVLGPKRLPDFGRSVGRGLREFKGALSGATSSDQGDDEEELDDERERDLAARERRLEERERELARGGYQA
ncbi:MAG: twin-arginine translocase TatA/TatE family subunit [Thermoleophilaceae bacterium]|nr:twin-arginine translocase TatA/TatE family subunit [Thermoleophilaceae bacterium]